MHDAAGREVARQGVGKRGPGMHTVELSTAQLSDGLYACTLLTHDGPRTVRLQVTHR